ncbi:hypothetical protein [Chitinasiproducens palmae]|uniref:Uncharacterized protein n=1 Tax=Chitinasiproducens palmae TaxID=1770053 RepID=A0A1H2PQX7_9BURK|nr:hypothetical protein [Chitinasiproducens palmae]SDV49220.1 hypothetical protein SAMN05216551_107162 [Chitinasiproducens palmae]
MSADQPKGTLPRKWIDTLFARMAAMYGSRFADMWPTHGDEAEREMQRNVTKEVWATELGKLSGPELKAGVAGLIHRKFPPTLPEFFAMCKEARAAQALASSATLALPNLPKATGEFVDANLERIKRASAGVRGKEPTAEWAFRILAGERTTAPMTPHTTECCERAVASYAGRLFMRQADNAKRYATIFEKANEKFGTAVAA